MADKECRVPLTESEWEMLAELAAQRTAERGQAVTVEEIVHTALREYVYRIERERRAGG